MKQKEKVLTEKLVKELGLDKLEVITSDMIEGYTCIGSRAFENCSSLTSITIPNSITSISSYAFSRCFHLASVILPNSLTSIGWSAFADCFTIKFLIIPNSVTNIWDYAFYGCTSLSSINIPSSLTTIENFVFYRCSSLTSVIIPDTVISIGKGAFSRCPDLTSVSIGNSVISIGEDAFSRCNKLKNIVIRDKTYETQTVVNGKCKAYKAFKGDMTCRSFQYEEGKTYEYKYKPILCKQGFHACLRLTDVFNNYRGKIGKDIVVHEVELEGVSDERFECDSRVVAKKISIGKRIL